MTIEGMNIYGIDVTRSGNTAVDMEAAYSAISDAHLREELPKGMVDQLTNWVTALFEDFDASSIITKENSSLDSATNNISAPVEDEIEVSQSNGFDNITMQAELANKLLREASAGKQVAQDPIFYAEKMPVDQKSDT